MIFKNWFKVDNYFVFNLKKYKLKKIIEKLWNMFLKMVIICIYIVGSLEVRGNCFEIWGENVLISIGFMDLYSWYIL